MNMSACTSVACVMGSCKVNDLSQGTPCTGGGGAKVCDGAGNCVQCAVNSDCASGNCQNNMCGAATLGHPCGANSDCQSGHCTDGVCCDQSCKGTCQACIQSLTGNQDGTCDNVAAGKAPTVAGQCTPSACGNNGKCDGNGGCEQVPTGTVCAPAACTNNVFSSQETCSNQMCPAPMMQDCMPYKCNGATGCPTSCAMDSQCSNGHYCMNPGAPGTCVAQLADGMACMGANDQSNQCLSGWCYGTPTVCQTNSCSDMLKDGTETDVDCGGGTCPGCMSGHKCLVNSDCTSNFCKANKTCM
jgi:hypothetical protein